MKNRKVVCGIYKITNKINNKAYVGKSIDIYERWEQHKKAKDDYPIHKALRKYGIENFIWEILEECPEDELDNREMFYIEKYETYAGNGSRNKQKGYNLTLGGDGGKTVYVADKTVLRLYKSRKFSVTETAERLNVSAGVISRKLNQNNVNILKTKELKEAKGKHAYNYFANAYVLSTRKNFFRLVKDFKCDIASAFSSVKQSDKAYEKLKKELSSYTGDKYELKRQLKMSNNDAYFLLNLKEFKPKKKSKKYKKSCSVKISKKSAKELRGIEIFERVMKLEESKNKKLTEINGKRILRPITN